MDEARLKALQNRAEMATQAAESIKELTAASADLSHVKLRLPYNTNTNKDLLTVGMMRRVYETGRRQVLKELEDELEGWMGGDGEEPGGLMACNPSLLEGCCCPGVACPQHGLPAGSGSGGY